jgi:hypothetical protein
MQLEELIQIIEDQGSSEPERERRLSQLNIFGYSEEAINNECLRYWKAYFRENMQSILNEQRSIESHILDFQGLKSCFDQEFEEFKNRKKDLGIDDITKYWNPLI